MNTAQDFGSLLQVAAEGAGIAWFLAFLVNIMIFAPFKAYYKVVNPIKISISDEIQAPGSMSNRNFVAQNATMLVKNRSDEDLLDCSITLVGINDTDEGNYPRLVERFDVPAGKTRRVAIAYWTARNAPYEDDKEIGICGPVMAGFGGNYLSIPISDYRATLLLNGPDLKPSKIVLRVWLDQKARRLCADLLEMARVTQAAT